MKALARLIALCAAAMLVPCAALATDSSSDGPSRYRATVSLGLLKLLGPIFEATAEFRVLPMIGVAAIGGGGNQSTANNSGFGPATQVRKIVQAGVQGNYYFSGNFDDGFHAGLEALWAQAQTQTVTGTGAASTTTAVNVGIYGGYKISYAVSKSVALTGTLQAGYKWVAYSSTGPVDNSEPGTLINIKAGASF